MGMSLPSAESDLHPSISERVSPQEIDFGAVDLLADAGSSSSRWQQADATTNQAALSMLDGFHIEDACEDQLMPACIPDVDESVKPTMQTAAEPDLGKEQDRVPWHGNDGYFLPGEEPWLRHDIYPAPWSEQQK